MTNEDVIRLAREANFYHSEYADSYAASLQEIEAFAKLVAKKAFNDGYEKGKAGFMEAVKLEREACAKVADEFAKQVLEHNFSALIANNIRSRGTHE